MHFTTSSSSSLLTVATTLLAITTNYSVQAKYTCDTSLGNFYPYCINVPDNAARNGQLLPTILMLSGSGARGPADKVKMLSGYDGEGKLLNQYFSGNRGQAQKAIGEQFITIIPIMPLHVNGQEQRHFFPDHIDKIYAQIRSKGYPVDWDRLHCTGYSAGGRGCVRQAVERPRLYASISNCAGPGEKPGAGTLSQQKAPSVLDRVGNMKHIPVMQFAGRRDNTVGQSSPKEQQDALVKSGNVNPQLVWLDADHPKMSTMPFEDVRMINFFLSNRRNGAASGKGNDGNNGNDNKGDDDDKDEKKEDGKKENKEDEKKKDGGKSSNLSPIASEKDSGSHKQFNAELGDATKKEEEEVKKGDESAANEGEGLQEQAPSSPSDQKSKPSSGKCTKKKIKRSRRASAHLTKRKMGEEGFAHPGPVRRGVYSADSDRPEFSASPRDAVDDDDEKVAKRNVVNHLSLAQIIEHAEKKEEIKRSGVTPLESLKAHAESRRSHGSINKLGRRLR